MCWLAWRRYKRQGRAPGHVEERLRAYVDGVAVAHPGFAGFKFRCGVIWTPEGAACTPGDLRALPLLKELQRTVARRRALPEQYQLF